jgi:LmbE family N-acetylglucosaminyl deacetylase
MNPLLRRWFRYITPGPLARMLDPFEGVRRQHTMDFSLRNVLVLAPHPDDEVIACGGTLCAFDDAGATTGCVFMTGGGAGNPTIEAERLVRLREQEAAACAATLGIDRPHFLRLADRQVAPTPQAVAALQQHLEQEKPQAVFLPSFFDAHPDHRATFEVFVKACHVLPPETPCYIYSLWTPLPYFNVAVDITPYRERKATGLAAYRSPQKMDQVTAATMGAGAYYALLAGIDGLCEPFIRCTAREIQALGAAALR